MYASKEPDNIKFTAAFLLKEFLMAQSFKLFESNRTNAVPKKIKMSEAPINSRFFSFKKTENYFSRSKAVCIFCSVS